MYDIKLRHSDNTFTVKHVTKNITLQHVGRRGLQGEPGVSQTIYEVPMFIISVDNVFQLQETTNYNRLSLTSQGINIAGYESIIPAETGGDLIIPSGDSNSRPGGSVGSTYFDTTLGKPIWHDGNFWVDATGTTV